MINGLSVLAVVPARGGSKRIPQKNVQLIGGIPLVAHSIIAAKQCEYIDQVIVSSDDDEILAIAVANGCLGDRRSEALSGDHALTMDVIKELLERNPSFDIIITLQPTSPLRSSKDIDNALSLFINKKADAVISVCKVEHPPHWANRLDRSLSMDGFIKPEVTKMRSQDLGDYYRLNGAIYCNKAELVRNSDSLIFENNAFAYVMSAKASVDIDTFDDLEYARYLFGKNTD